MNRMLEWVQGKKGTRKKREEKIHKVVVNIPSKSSNWALPCGDQETKKKNSMRKGDHEIK